MDINTFLAKMPKSSGDISVWAEKLTAWAGTHGLRLVFILLGAWILTRLGKVVLGKFLEHILKARTMLNSKFSNQQSNDKLFEQERLKTLQKVGFSVIKTGVWAIALVTGLSELGVNIAPLLAGLGVAGLALGMGARSLIQDYISGIFILLEDHYRVGERVDIGGTAGIVKALDLRKTVLQSEEGALHYINNSQIKKVTNFSRK